MTVFSRLATSGLRNAATRSSAMTRHMSTTSSQGFFTIEKESNGVAVVTLDAPNEKVNTLSSKMMEDFASLLETLRTDNSIKAAVIISGKKDSFIAGADIAELATLSRAEDGTALSTAGQERLSILESFPKPIVAAINGACLGGGLEFALACTYRVATENKKTNLGLPEVKLGLLPGAGGTQRLPKLVGIQAALDMILTGKNIKPVKAKRMGLIDEVTDPSALRSSAVAAAMELVEGKIKPKAKKKSLMNKLLEDNPLGRMVIWDQATKAAMKASGGNYPAIPKILETIKTGIESGSSAGYKAEAKAFGELTQSSESAALQGLFFGTTELKKNRFGKPTTPVKTIGVLGAGLMGAGVAEVSAGKGFNVLLKDLNHAGLSRGMNQIGGNLDNKVKRKRMTKFDRDMTMSRVVGLTEDDNWQDHFSKCDLVLEAVLEEMSLKHRVVKQMEEIIPEHAVMATNTSALPIREIALASKRPENIVGMHYFSPVDKMPLLEVITTDKTAKHVAAAAVDVGLKQGKTVIVVKDVPGFYVNRSLGPYMSEVVSLIQDGVDLPTLDKAMRAYGFPVGPITLSDEVGFDVAMHVQATLAPDLGKRMGGGDPAIMQDLVKAGFLGRKNNKGFWTYPAKGQKQKGPKVANPDVLALLEKYKRTPVELKTEEIQERLAFRFMNEALWCLQDEIIATPTDGDIGAVFGIGFPPFRGGPFREIDRMGAQTFVDKMNMYTQKYGEHFEPAPIVVEYAKAGKKFHN